MMKRDRRTRQEKLDDLTRRFRERLEAEWPEGEADVTQIEDRVSRIEREVLREVTEEWVREQTGKRLGNSTACPCGAKATYRRQNGIDFVTAHGRVRAERAYFYCSACGEGHCPQDQAWGLGPGNTTPTVQALVGYLAATEPYTRVPATLARVRPQIHLGTKTVELIAQRLGERVQQDPPQLVGRATRPVAAAVDGAMVLTRSGYKEVRGGVVYEPDAEAGRTPEACRGLRKEYVATFGSRDSLVREVCRRVEQRRPTPDTEVAALGDGAHWIWDAYAEHLPCRVEILDFYHAMEHLAKVAAAMYPEDPAAAQAWLVQMRHELRHIGPWEVLRQLRAWEPRGRGSRAAQEIRRQELAYFERNQERMRYPEYARKGFPIGTGAMEGACNFLIAARFKQAGMRWNPSTAEPLLHLRAALVTHTDLDLRRYAYAA